MSPIFNSLADIVCCLGSKLIEMASSPKKPHFLLICGGWHSPEVWGPVRERLKQAGYESTAIPLVSVGAPTYDMTEDVQAIRDATKLLVDQGQEVIVAMHSYAGQPGSDAMRGFSRVEQHISGSNSGGAVVRLVFIMAYVVPEGFEPAQRDKPVDAPSWMNFDMESGMTTVTPEDAKRVFYNDLPDEQATEWVAKLRPWSAGCSFSKSTYAGWKHIPSTYVICSNDQSVFREWARPMLEQARADPASAIDTVEEVDAGHCVMASKPDWTAQMLERAANSSVE